MPSAQYDIRLATASDRAQWDPLWQGYLAFYESELADEVTDEVLGVHIIGPGASELIAECVVTMEFHGASEDLARIVHAHPTLSEAVHEAALHVDKRAIHRGN